MNYKVIDKEKYYEILEVIEGNDTKIEAVEYAKT